MTNNEILSFKNTSSLSGSTCIIVQNGVLAIIFYLFYFIYLVVYEYTNASLQALYVYWVLYCTLRMSKPLTK